MGPELMRDAVDDQRLHATQHDSKLLVRVTVRGDGRSGIELDQVHHRVLAEQRSALDTVDETERLDVGKADELRPHAGIISSGVLGG